MAQFGGLRPRLRRLESAEEGTFVSADEIRTGRRTVFSRKGRNIEADPNPPDPMEYAIVDPGPEYLIDDRSLTAAYNPKPDEDSKTQR